LADLIAVPENPLKKISALRQVEFVMQEGRIARSAIEGVSEIAL
jgi:imidazolonepropionase-like amidohydrolase